MSGYTSTYPSGLTVDPAIKKFFEDFYQISDTPNGHDKYADFVTDDGVIIMASKKVQGRSGTSFSHFPFRQLFHASGG